MNVEFTDRYGGNAPSWLRGCHSDCEAMGVVPIFVAQREPGENECVTEDEGSPKWRGAWEAAHAKPHAEPCDGWHFVSCPDCNGTGRVSLLRSFALVPRWLWKGAGFIRSMGPNKDVRPPHMNAAQHWWLIVKCAYLYDLGWKR